MFFCESSVIAYTVSCFQAQGKIQEGQIKRKKDYSSPLTTTDKVLYQSGSVLIPLTVLRWNLRKQNKILRLWRMEIGKKIIIKEHLC